MGAVFLQAFCYWKPVFHLDVLPILFLQQSLVIGFDAKCEVGAGNDVPPVTSHSHLVPFLSRKNPNLVAVTPVMSEALTDLIVPDGRVSLRSGLGW